MFPRPKRLVPGPGQESVWDYPRPPAVQPTSRHVRIGFGDLIVADTTDALRVLETAGAPTWYLPREDVDMDLLRPSRGHGSACEWKGPATYFDLVVGGRVSPRAAWTYERPLPGYETLAGRIAFYAGRVDEATVDGELVRPQPGNFYGGWVTDDVVGPFKGEPGTEGW
jgi:uncharacterized protein (DUF427 family)